MARYARVPVGLLALIASLLVTNAPVNALDYKWNVLGGGSQTWQTPTNWTPNGVPDSISSIATLAVPLTGNLNVSVGTSTVTVGGLNIGGTGGAVTTEISGGVGGKLIFSDNDDADFDDNNSINGDDFLIWQRGLGTGTTNATGDADGDGDVDADDLAAWRQVAIANFTPGTPPVYPSRVVVNSNGAAGTVNTISVPVRAGVVVDATPTYRGETVEIRGTQSLNLAGGFRLSGNGGLNSFLPSPSKLTVNGIILAEDSEAVPTTARDLSINAANGGLVELPGVISGGGSLTLGTTSTSNALPLASFLITGNNTKTGPTILGRANALVNSDTAFGTGVLRATANVGSNIISDNDSRVIPVRLEMSGYATVRGENSLTFTGPVVQTNSRGFINLLPAGKLVTLAGKVYGRDEPSPSRILIFDGSGKTVISGEFSNLALDPDTGAELPEDGTNFTGLNKQGSGSLHLNGPASYGGVTTVNGGTLHYSVFNETVATSSIVAHFGAVGGDAYSSFGTPDTMQTNFAFPSKLNAVSTGGLMVNAAEAGATFDFVGGALSAFPNMSLAAPETGLTFTGSIVPANSTYRLGGGSGTLTLPNATLTGANGLVVTNGGVVALNGANTYSGVTSVVAKYASTLTPNAISNGNSVATRSFTGTVLAANNLGTGASSSIGSSSSAAANLVIQGSTVRYTGGGQSTDRLFTVGTGGGTLESSGAGAINFTNTGNLGMDEPESRTVTKASNATLSAIGNIDDLVVGMGVNGPGIPVNATITAINYPTVAVLPVAPLAITVTISGNATDATTESLNFTSIARTLTLGGANTGDNTLRPNIVNGAAATNVAKNDAGKWILTGANAYTGTTAVNGGTLLVNGTHVGGGAYAVASGATLGGAGSIGANITTSGIVSPGGNAATAGALAVTGGVTFSAGSTALIEIGGTGVGQFDELNLTGALAAGGTFDVDLIGGFNPVAGNSFDVLDFGSAAGTFTLSLPALGGGLAWNTASLLTTGTISVVNAAVSVPEPSSLVMGAGILALAARRRRGGRRCGDRCVPRAALG
jgi:fibronectin-binding autotransporter adhesin